MHDGNEQLLTAYEVGQLIAPTPQAQRPDGEKYVLSERERLSRIGRAAIKSGEIPGLLQRRKFYARRSDVERYLMRKSAVVTSPTGLSDYDILAGLSLFITACKRGFVTQAIAALEQVVTQSSVSRVK